MKISLEWLNEYVDLKGLAALQISELLSNRGLPTESIEDFGQDTVLDIEVTSNRSDCLSYIGIARELAAALDRRLQLPSVELSEGDRTVGEFVDVQIAEPALCPRYTARVIEGVKVGASPDWLRRRLESAGLRSVNNVVDATNYAMLEHGQPPHAFDYHKLADGKIIVRKGGPGEKFVSIDGTKCDLDDSMLVIADGRGPVAIAGVMGGLDSEVTEQTTTILLEEAQFEPVSIRRTSRRLNLQSEASFRFERQVDGENIAWASARCAGLIVQLAGGQVVSGLADVYPGKQESRTVGMRFSRLRTLLGIEVPKDCVLGIFKGLGFDPEVKNEDLVVCRVPSWRHDIYREADLIEEAARCYGYDKIPVEKKLHIEVAPQDRREQTAGRIRQFLTGCGFYETITVSFVNETVAAAFDSAAGPGWLKVRDQSQTSTPLLRRSLLGSLAGVMQSNVNAGNTDCRFFELADTFIPSERNEQLPVERMKVGLGCSGDFRRLRGALEGLCGMICPQADLTVKPAELAWASAGAHIALDGEIIGVAGEMTTGLAEQFDLNRLGGICLAEIDFLSLMERTGATITARPVPRFPAVSRDLSLIVDEPVSWSQIVEVIEGCRLALLEKVDFAGLYRGKPVEEGKKSITVSLRFRDEDGTLRHETVDEFEKQILGAIKTQLKAELRTA